MVLDLGQRELSELLVTSSHNAHFDVSWLELLADDLGSRVTYILQSLDGEVHSFGGVHGLLESWGDSELSFQEVDGLLLLYT